MQVGDYVVGHHVFGDLLGILVGPLRFDRVDLVVAEQLALGDQFPELVDIQRHRTLMHRRLL